jgi:hypothetical protein
MKITIESTDTETEVDGVLCRIWAGVTESGTECVVFVHRIAVHNDEDQSEFERELRENPAPKVVEIAGMRQDWG